MIDPIINFFQYHNAEIAIATFGVLVIAFIIVMVPSEWPR